MVSCLGSKAVVILSKQAALKLVGVGHASDYPGLALFRSWSHTCVSSLADHLRQRWASSFLHLGNEAVVKAGPGSATSEVMSDTDGNQSSIHAVDI